MADNLDNQDASLNEENKINWFAISFIALLVIVLVVIAGCAGVKLGNYRKQNNYNALLPSPTQVSSKITSTVPGIVGVVTNKVFYLKDNNIFSHDVETKETMKWTDYIKNKDTSPPYSETGEQIPFIRISDVRIIDENTLGFVKCGILSRYNSGCGIYILDLKTKKISEKEKFAGFTFVLALDFYSPNKFAYTIIDYSNNKLQTSLSNDGTLEILDLDSFGATGGEETKEDVARIRFSEDGKYLFTILTLSPSKMFNYNIYIYDLSNNSRVRITPEATHPEWLDNQTIVYRKYLGGKEGGDGLYLLNVDTGDEEKIKEANDGSYKPSALTGTGKVVYSVYPNGQVWIYDSNTGENKKVLDNALNGFWVTPTKIVYEKGSMCRGYECGFDPFEVESVNVFDLESGTQTDSILDFQSFWEGEPVSEFN